MCGPMFRLFFLYWRYTALFLGTLLRTMIERLEATNFRAFDHFRMDLAKITVVLGPNNSGKSSLLAFPRILAQTIDTRDPELPLLLNGSLGDFGTYKDLIHGNSLSDKLNLSITVRDMVQPGSNVVGSASRLTVEYGFLSKKREIILRSAELRQNDKLVLATARSRETGRQTLRSVSGKRIPAEASASASSSVRMLNFIPSIGLPFEPKEGASKVVRDVAEIMRTSRSSTAQCRAHLHRALDSIDFLSAARLPPERTYLFTGERRNRIGAHGENTASLLSVGGKRGRGGGGARILENVNQWLRSAGMARGLSICSLSDRHYEIRVGHSKTNEIENLADVGYGHSQVLPVLVGGYACQPGGVFIVEEPEIHLHPAAQASLGDFFLGLYKQNIQSLIETHSEYLILRLQQHVANGTLPASDIAIYYVDASKQKKSLKRFRLDNLGSIVHPWPNGFFPQRMEEALRLSRAREQRRSMQ